MTTARSRSTNRTKRPRSPLPVDGVIAEYRSRLPLLEAFTHDLNELVTDLLETQSIRVHSVTGRVKEEASLSRKITKESGSKYTRLDDITDPCGVRVITYFSDQVEAVADLIRSEFTIDSANSVDKRQALSPDQFGYLSQHYVISYSSRRAGLTEKKKFAGMKCEIQVRSILQHAWAEIEHDLGYKGEYEVPKSFRRRFARLAGLLEIGDSEFCQIRIGLNEYTDSIKGVLEKDPASVTIERTSAAILAQHSQLVRGADDRISRTNSLPILEQDSLEGLGGEATRLTASGLASIGEVLSLLEANQKAVVKWATSWLPRSNNDGGFMHRGMCLFYLAYFVAAQRGDESLSQFTEAVFSEDQRSRITGQIRAAYALVTSAPNSGAPEHPPESEDGVPRQRQGRKRATQA